MLSILRAKMIRNCCKALKIPDSHAEWAVAEVFTQINLGIARDGFVKIEGFGKLSVKKTKEYKSISNLPKYRPGEMVEYGGNMRVRFKPGLRLKAALRGKEYIPYGKKEIEVRVGKDRDRQHQIRQQEGSEEVLRPKNTPKSWSDTRS